MQKNNETSAFYSAAKYYLTIGSIMLSGLLLLQIMQWLNMPTLKLSSDDILWFTAPSLYFLSFPIAFLFLIYALREKKRFAISFSPVACAVSVVCFMLSAGLNIKTYHSAVAILSFSGCVAGAFVFINFREFITQALVDKRQSSVALIGASASAIYSIMDNYLWQRISYSSANTSQWLLELMNMEMKSGVHKNGKELAATLYSDYFTLIVYRPCSGLEGIFLFIFLLSIAVLFDWKILKRIKLIETYLIGFIFMYLGNVLRIVSLFLLGHFAHAPDASPQLAYMRGLPSHIFHSFIGQIYYVIIFMIFAKLLYSYVSKKPE